MKAVTLKVSDANKNHKKKKGDMDRTEVTAAPDWSQEAGQLLNEPSDNDWRQLAQILGYDTVAIRNWMTMRDPTLAVLNDCFEKQAPGDATRDIIEALERMERDDVIDVVEGRKAVRSRMNTSRAAITPSVFLSFDPSDEDRVRVLSRHLNKAGLNFDSECDIVGSFLLVYFCVQGFTTSLSETDTESSSHQDEKSLWERRKRCLRSSLVVVCCLTPALVKSDQCVAEVRFSTF